MKFIDKILIEIKDIEPVLQIGASREKATFEQKTFVPTNDMSMSQLAEVLTVYINLRTRSEMEGGQNLTQDEFDNLSDDVKKFFQ